MKKTLMALVAAACLSACGSAPVADKQAAEKASGDGQWHASTLSDETIAKANATVKDYQKCLNTETVARINDPLDCRVIADQILKACEPKLTGIKDAYGAEGVPDSLSERYMRKTRSQGAQSVLRYVMAVQAMRAGEAEERAAANNNNKQPR
ncbi:MAG: hypothetical protein H6R26_1078 [Proteobacteria bacterium]|nr:hypothetical protein [Pseudomonadota bacterium]